MAVDTKDIRDLSDSRVRIRWAGRIDSPEMEVELLALRWGVKTTSRSIAPSMAVGPDAALPVHVPYLPGPGSWLLQVEILGRAGVLAEVREFRRTSPRAPRGHVLVGFPSSDGAA